jgi:hypothetical protein
MKRVLPVAIGKELPVSGLLRPWKELPRTPEPFFSPSVPNSTIQSRIHNLFSLEPHAVPARVLSVFTKQ